MTYKDSKSRLELVKRMINRNKNLETPYGDFCRDTIYALENVSVSTERLEELLKKDDLDEFFSILSKGVWCSEAEKQKTIFARRFKRNCFEASI